MKNAKSTKPVCRFARLTAVIALLLLCAFSLSACSRNKASLIIAGSTSVQPFAEILAEEYFKLTKIEIDVQGGGSALGINAVRSGAAHIGMSSRALKADEQDLWSIEIAKDGLVIIVHPDNPVGNLTVEQIRGIYAGTITNWSEVGGRNAKIHVITREEGSGTRSAFEDLVMAKTRITPKAIVQDANGAVRQLVSSDKNAIGFISLGLVDKTVKALKLDGVEATWDNIKNEAYALFRPFLFITEGEPEGQARQFIDFVISPQGQQILTDAGLIPSW
ncbi:MAG: phosphate ABC transporter substrate-binding protein [Clostridiales bacterium]|nr:phosphate ABC transporter substrate-binding protein [Clostridiales bacterium]